MQTALTRYIFAFVLALTPFAAVAQSGSTYDWQSGNFYNWSQRLDGSTHVRGMNAQTGSNWSTTLAPSGDMRGFDAGGNMWNYDDSSGVYQNFGTGRTCIGEGAARTCF